MFNDAFVLKLGPLHINFVVVFGLVTLIISFSFNLGPLQSNLVASLCLAASFNELHVHFHFNKGSTSQFCGMLVLGSFSY
jgi:hypothetical protein